jgi:hypothetical protein
MDGRRARIGSSNGGGAGRWVSIQAAQNNIIVNGSMDQLLEQSFDGDSRRGFTNI